MEEEIKQLQNKRKKLISQQKEEARKKRDRRLYEKGGNYGIQRYQRKLRRNDE